MIAILGWCSTAEAQKTIPVVINRLTGPVTLDGRSTEAAWEAIDPLPLTVYQPVYNGPATERTEIRVGYDDDYLYLAGRFYTSDPSSIRGNSLYRDRYSGGDVFSVLLDTFNDNENGLWFFTTPTGVRLDWTIFNDAEPVAGPPFNESWNTFWDVKTAIDDTGWFAEMRIPFSSLGFQDTDGEVVMGLMTYRFMAESNERHIFPDVEPNWVVGYAKPSEAQDVSLAGVYARTPLYLTPYVLGGQGLQKRLAADRTGYEDDIIDTREIGADLKYSLTNNLTLDLTVNTDFAQVEADDQQVNLSRFSLFFPEKRQFFQERAGVFEFRTGAFDRLFYSRVIGLNNGEVVPILGGARLVGRLGDWDVGLINMQTQSSTALPSENFGVLRLKRQVLNPFSYAGGMLTTRLGNDGSYNVAYGFDTVLRVTGSEFATVKWAQSFDQARLDAAPFNVWDAGLLQLRWDRRSLSGLSYSLVGTHAGGDYRPGIGFLTRRDFYGGSASASYGWFMGQNSSIRRVAPSLFASAFYRNGDGSLQSGLVTVPLSLGMQSGDVWNASVSYQVEDLRFPLTFAPEVTVPEARYRFVWGQASYLMRDANLLRFGARLRAGQFYDGINVSPSLEPTWNVSPHLELGLTYQLNLLQFSERSQDANLHVARLLVRTALDTRLSANAFIQYATLGKALTGNIRLRYNIREGNDLWLVYNTAYNTDIERFSPNLPRLDGQTLLVKYTYTFGL
ncbi:MAG: hypothetical protein RhofKO_12550 [Rhodothermales bacterium]